MVTAVAYHGLEPAITSLLAGRVERFREASAHSDADDLEAVHRLRVAARRLHAAVVVWTPVMALPAAVRPGALRRVERRFGARRDLDVLASRIAELGPANEATALLRDQVHREWDEAAERGRMALRRRAIRRTVDGLDSWLRKPAFTPPAGLGPVLLLPWLVAPALGRLCLHPGWLVATPPDASNTTDPAARALHSLRRQLKVLRYRLECVAGWYYDRLDPWLDELHRMQDALGDWRDEGVLLDRLDRAGLDAGLGENARRRAVAVLGDWPEWRARYLDPEYRRRLWHLLEAPDGGPEQDPAAPPPAG